MIEEVMQRERQWRDKRGGGVVRQEVTWAARQKAIRHDSK